MSKTSTSTLQLAPVYRETFDRLFSGEKDNTWLPMRRSAMQSFESIGLPGPRTEAWRYTNLAKVSAMPFVPAPSTEQLQALELEKLEAVRLDGIRLVFENGRYRESLSSLQSLPAGAIVGSLARHHDHPKVKEYLQQNLPLENEAFVALNTAFMPDGAFVFIPRGVQIEQPIHLVFVNDARQEASVAFPRNLIIAEESSSVVVVESWHSLPGSQAGFTNAVTEAFTGRNAKLELVKLQLEDRSALHIGHTQATVQRDATFNINTITLGGALVRNNLGIQLSEEHATAHLFGLYLLAGNQHVDNHTLVDHAVPHGLSNELYKGVLDQQSEGVFSGKILVRKDAQKTNAYQSNKNILLSDDALMNAKPQLEIFADDVKCSHGATTGQLDAEALFYLRSRGIGEAGARAFLNIAFAADVINNIPLESLREQLMQRIEKKLLDSAP